MQPAPKVYVLILVKRKSDFLLGLLSKEWAVDGKRLYGIPGRDLLFRETIGDAVKRIIKEEIACTVTTYAVTCVNVNYEFGNHYIGIGAVAEIAGEPQLMKPKDWETWEWIPENKVPQNLFPTAKDMIECYRTGKFNVSE